MAVLPGCGFEPIHARPHAENAVARNLAAIRVAGIGEGRERRIGQILRNELIDRLTAGVGRQAERYTLAIDIERSTAALQVQTNDTVTRYNLSLRATFVLRDSQTEEVLHDGTAHASGSYDVVESEYATLVAEENTAREVARDLSNTIANLLALHFVRNRDA